LDYKTEDFTKLSGFDIFLDLTHETEKGLKILKKGGKAISANTQPSAEIKKETDALGVTFEYFTMQSNATDLSVIADLIQKGTFKVVIDSVFKFDEYKKAFEKSETGRAVGKVVIEF